jgi:ketopantoate reductase
MAEINAAYAGSHNIVSMRQDLLHHRLTEIDYLNSAVAKLGQTHGFDCPVNDALTRIIKAKEAISRQYPIRKIRAKHRENCSG